MIAAMRRLYQLGYRAGPTNPERLGSIRSFSLQNMYFNLHSIHGLIGIFFFINNNNRYGR